MFINISTFINEVIVFLAKYTKLIGINIKRITSLDIVKLIYFSNRKRISHNGWIDSSLNPNTIITREEAGAYLWRAYLTEKVRKEVESRLKLKVYATNDNKSYRVNDWNEKRAFSDSANIDSKYLDEIFQLYANGVYSGEVDSSGLFVALKPKERLSRATCCTIIMRTFKD